MGRMKGEGMRLEGLYDQARLIAVKAGAIEPCPVHEDIYLDLEDIAAVEDAKKLGTSMVLKGEVDGDQEELMEALEQVIGESADTCPICDKD